MSALYHYTCDHGHSLIGGGPGAVIPANMQTKAASGLPGEFAWFTDLSVPIRDALGLTSNFIACDRTVHRYRVLDVTNVVPWREVRRSWPWAAELEAAHGARPRHWFVSAAAVPVTYDPIAQAAA